MPKLPCILLVDDDPTTNYLNRKLLERLEVAEQVLVAENGREALHIMQAPPADQPVLVFLDVNMPIMNGIQFMEAYAQLPAAQQGAVVVVLTTSVHPQDRQRISQLPVADFLSKPLTQGQVERVLRECCA